MHLWYLLFIFVKVKDELDESHDLKSDGYDAETLKPNLKLENDENGLQDSGSTVILICRDLKG